MIRSPNKKSPDRKQREALRMAHAAPAWKIWTELARNDVMADTAGKDRMMERHNIVVAMIEINSQQLRCDSAAAGLDIERLNARRDFEQQGDTPETREALAAIDRREAEIDDKKRKLAQSRDWLESSLRDFDNPIPPDAPQSKTQN